MIASWVSVSLQTILLLPPESRPHFQAAALCLTDTGLQKLQGCQRNWVDAEGFDGATMQQRWEVQMLAVSDLVAICDAVQTQRISQPLPASTIVLCQGRQQQPLKQQAVPAVHTHQPCSTNSITPKLKAGLCGRYWILLHKTTHVYAAGSCSIQ